MNFGQLSAGEMRLFSFFAMYLYGLEQNEVFLAELKTVAFHSDEANTDKDLKVAVKNFMTAYPYLSFSSDIRYQLEVDDQILEDLNLSHLSNAYIHHVYLPEDLPEEHKQSIKNSKHSVYTNPDLYIEILGITAQRQYISLELKSTKQDKIPGSSAQQANPYEWTLFVKHSATHVDVVSGLYANTVTGKIPFPDRSPRPQVSFSQLKAWNDSFRQFNGNTLKFCLDTQALNQKALIISDWEQSLVNDWMDYIKSDKKPNKWFDHTQRIFVVELIHYYESLSEEEKENFLLRNKSHMRN